MSAASRARQVNEQWNEMKSNSNKTNMNIMTESGVSVTNFIIIRSIRRILATIKRWIFDDAYGV